MTCGLNLIRWEFLQGNPETDHKIVPKNVSKLAPKIVPKIVSKIAKIKGKAIRFVPLMTCGLNVIRWEFLQGAQRNNWKNRNKDFLHTYVF